MDTSLLIGVGGTVVVAAFGFVGAVLTSRNSLKAVRLQGAQQHESQVKLWQAQQLAHAYQGLGGWLTSVYHATHDVQLRETWRDDGKIPDFEKEIRAWETGPMRLPETVAATRVTWSYAVRKAEVELRAMVQQYVAFALDHEGDEAWFEAMNDGLESVLVMIDRMMIRMREEIYGRDPGFAAERAKAPPTTQEGGAVAASSA